MDKKNIYLDFDLRFQEIKELNPSFDVAKIAVAYHGLNRNHSDIPKEVFENAAPSLFNIPVVGRYIPEDNDFGGHDIIVTEENGNQTIEVATVPFGVVPESANISWETITEDDGTEHEYLMTDCVIWKRSYGYKKLVSQSKWSQSMEITVNDFDLGEDNTMIIKDFTFCALCILGNDIEPCFESANIQFSATPDNEEFKKNFSAMLSELKELATQDLKDAFEISTEGGGLGLDNEVTKFDGETTETTPEDTSGETTGTEDNDDTETPGEETTNDSNEPAGGSDDSGDDDVDTSGIEAIGADDAPPKKKLVDNSLDTEDFSKTYGELREMLDGAVGQMCEENQLRYMCDFDDNYVYMEVINFTETGIDRKYSRAKYSNTDGTISLFAEEEMFIKWLTADELAKVEAERNELNALRDFKADRLEELHREEVDAFVADNFGDVAETEEFTALGDKVYELEREALTEKLYAIRGKHAVFSIAKKENKDEATKIPVESGKKSKNEAGRYGNLFATYAKTK